MRNEAVSTQPFCDKMSVVKDLSKQSSEEGMTNCRDSVFCLKCFRKYL